MVWTSFPYCKAPGIFCRLLHARNAHTCRSPCIRYLTLAERPFGFVFCGVALPQRAGVLEGIRLFFKHHYIKGIFALSCLHMVEVRVLSYTTKVSPQLSLPCSRSSRGRRLRLVNVRGFS